ncbi:redoxin domain-containing protein [Litorimonas sp. WD9-15]|uniref:redoxin domain-containing protein n=1 Tax=Litorimonas sp. WD9-15 TaxID=3418716 RepID=UPI003D05D92C
MSISKVLLSTLAVSALALAAPATAKIATGSNVSDMTVTDSNGVQHNLSDFAGQKVVLEWTNEGCPYVKKHYSTNNMQKTQAMATADGAVWLSVISSAPGKQGYKSPDEANAWKDAQGAVSTAIVLDPEGEMGKTFAAKTTPHMYIIDESQTLVYQGAIDDNRSANPATVEGAQNYVLAAMDDLKAGNAVAISDTAPYGCSVKYKS